MLGLRVGVATLVIAAIVLLLSHIDVKHDMRRMNVRVLSGEPEGNYHALVDRLGALAAERRGVVENVASAGSLENVQRLAAAAKGSCDVQFGLAQDGTALGPRARAGRAAAPTESVLFLGRDADAVRELADVKGMRIGIGPAGSGTAAVVRAMFELPELAALGVALSNHDVAEQLDLAARGELDLAVIVMDEDAPLVQEWVGRRGLRIAGFAHADSVARRLPHLRTGRIGAGQYDAVRLFRRPTATCCRSRRSSSATAARDASRRSTC